MGSIHPLTRAGRAVRPFCVRVHSVASSDEVTVLACTASEAMSQAADLLFGGDEDMPAGGVVFSVKPIAMGAAPCAA